MQELAVTLRFNRVCLGAAKRRRHGQVVFAFERDPNGRVMFLPSAWASLLRYAAKLANRHQAEVKRIDFCPVIGGEPCNDWRRTVVTQGGPQAKSHFVVHEAFRPGDTATISVVLPEEISAADFEHLLNLVGKYKGFSPFNNDSEKYGTFEVVSIEPVAGPQLNAN
jgi:hypothetical protein